MRTAALKLFADQGYVAVSMRQLAAEVGVQAGALYLYSPDKQTLLFGLMQDHLAAMLADWAALPKPKGAVAAFEAFVRFHIRYELDNPAAVRLCALEYRSLSPENRTAFDALRDSYEGALEKILREGQGEKHFTFADPRIATKALMAMLTGIGHWYVEDGKLARDRVERIFWNMARKSVGA